jgi:hypothetical protein
MSKKSTLLEWMLVAGAGLLLVVILCGIAGLFVRGRNEQTAIVPTAPAPTAPPQPTETIAPTATVEPTTPPDPTVTPVLEPTAAPSPTAAPAPTALPEPTALPSEPASTPNLATVALEPLLIQQGDLPDGLAPGEIRQELPAKYDGIPGALNKGFQHFEQDGEISGGVGVLLYDDPDAGYAFLIDGLIDTHQAIDIGERGRVNSFDPATLGLPSHPSTSVVFQRCGVVADILMVEQNEASVIAYARRLDQRLQNTLCPDEQIANTAPEPTVPPLPTAEPEQAAPASEFSPITISGAGNTVTDPIAVPFPLSRVTYSQNSDRLIQAHAYPTNDDWERLLVNEIGANTGAWLFESPADEYYFEVEAEGSWTITMEPLGFLDQNIDTLNGTGAWVTGVYQTAQQGRVPYVAIHEGEGLAQIHLHCEEGSDLVLNEIGTITSETVVEFRGELCFWEIEADQGTAWSFRPR